MRILITAAVLSSLALSPQARGSVSKVTTGAADATGTVQVTVEGTHPCGAVQLDYGDGSAVTHAISGLPAAVSYEYTRVGQYVITAKGMGNCDGTATTNVRVNRVRRQADPPPPPPPTPAPAPPMRFKEMDANGDGVITRAEWRGNRRSFDQHDWNGDGRLAGEEVRIGPSVTATVDSRDDWTDVGVYVRRGETLAIDVTGTIHFSPESPATGPEGVVGRRAPSRSPLPNDNIGALIGRVGRSAPFLVGTGADVTRAPIDGPLYLRINDDLLSDNRGEFRVTISVAGARGR